MALKSSLIGQEPEADILYLKQFYSLNTFSSFSFS